MITMNNNKQSSVEWLVEQIKKDINLRLRGFDIDKALEQAKAMHKEEIKDAFTNGFISSRSSNRIADEIFYNETFGE